MIDSQLEASRLPSHNQPLAASASGSSRRRWISLDVLRGMTVAFMILVNTAGDGSASYAQLRHSAWDGCTLTDLVFPLFLFIMGVSTALSFEGRLARGVPKSAIARGWVRLPCAPLYGRCCLLESAFFPSFGSTAASFSSCSVRHAGWSYSGTRHESGPPTISPVSMRQSYRLRYSCL